MKKEIKKTYKNWARTYDKFETNISIILEQDILIKKADPEKNEIILDAGCGTGRYIKELKKNCKKVTGIDFSKEMLEVAKNKNPEVNFIQADLTKKLPFKSSTFHKVLSSLVFSHIENIENPLREFHRILKKGGKLIITDFPWHSTIDWTGIKYKKEQKKDYLDIEKTCEFHSIAEYIDKATSIGFKVKEILPLRVNPPAKKYLTKESYEKNKGKWGTVIYIFEKR